MNLLDPGMSGRVEWHIDELPEGMVLLSVEGVNTFVNTNVKYTSDGLHDTWQDAKVTLDKWEGDCEDYCVAKYALLRYAGWKNMTVVCGMDVAEPTLRGRRVGHALLFVGQEEGSEPLVLDNRTPIVHSASYFHKFFSPLYAVNHTQTWFYMHD